MSNLESNLKSADVVIVGAGFYGSVVAERLATQRGKNIVLLDIRSHIGGNSYSFTDETTNIEVHKYGSHLFHTSDEQVWNYLSQFTEFNDYQHRVYTEYKNKVYTMPINLETINSFYEKNLTPQEAFEFIKYEINKYKVEDPKNLEEKAISLIGKPLYEAFIYGYTKKQWETDPTNLPANIITRLPVRFNYNNRYFKDKYEGLPRDGYGKLFERMLNHKNIKIHLETNYFKIRDLIPEGTKVIYSGPIDKFFNYKHGVLGWRTIDFVIERKKVNDFQGTSVMNYAEAEVPYTRIHEFKHYHPERKQSSTETIIYKEFSRTAGKEEAPYYPINRAEDKEMYKKYLDETKNLTNIFFGGRLATYKYLDMHQVISMALNSYDSYVD